MKEFNEKYQLNIINTKIDKLEFWNFGDKTLKDFTKIEFEELKELFLNSNYISDIYALCNAKFEKLEIINLANNRIKDIKVLSEVNFKELKELYLNSNYISDINVFEYLKN